MFERQVCVFLVCVLITNVFGMFAFKEGSGFGWREMTREEINKERRRCLKYHLPPEYINPDITLSGINGLYQEEFLLFEHALDPDDSRQKMFIVTPSGETKELVGCKAIGPHGKYCGTWNFDGSCGYMFLDEDEEIDEKRWEMRMKYQKNHRESLLCAEVTRTEA